jgi:outer membrane lipoprotein-sorting protein
MSRRSKMRRAGNLPAAAALAVALGSFPTLAASSPSPSPAAKTPDTAQAARDLLHAAMDAPKTVTYDGEVQTTRWGSGAAMSTIARIEHQAPDLTRRLYIAPDEAYGEFVITCGATSYAFDVKHNRIVQTKNPVLDSQVALNDNFALLVANYRPVLGANETIAGRDTQTVSLVNKFTGVRSMRLWIDKETKLILAKEVYHTSGSIAMRVRFDDIRFAKSIPADLFSTSVPSGFTMTFGYRFSTVSTDIDRMTHSAGFDVEGPRYLPDGFSILSADLTDINRVRTLHLIYSDGVRMISLFENTGDTAANFGSAKPRQTKIENHDASFVTEGSTTLLVWHDRGLSLALVGDLDLDELKAIAASVLP